MSTFAYIERSAKRFCTMLSKDAFASSICKICDLVIRKTTATSSRSSMMIILILQFLSFLALYAVTNHFFHKFYNLPPTPFFNLPILGHLHLLRRPLHRTFSDLSARYGPIFLLQLGSRRALIISSPSVTEQCLVDNDVAFANRPRLLSGKHLGYNFTSLAWLPYGDRWRSLRRLVSLEILSPDRLRVLSGVRADEVKALVRRLAVIGTDDPIDMKREFYELTLNVMMRMIAGKRYYGDKVVDSEEVREFREIMADTSRLGVTVDAGEFLPFLRWMGFNGVEKSLIQLQKRRDDFMQKVVEQHKRAGIDGMLIHEGNRTKKTKTLIQVMMSLQEDGSDYYKDEAIKSIMLVLLAGGTETTSGAMEWAMTHLLNDPQVMEKARSEIDAVVGHDRFINDSDLGKLPYLHCVIYESLRIHPLPLLMPHESLRECHVGGYRVPGGTLLLVNAHSIQNNPKNWPDPEKFIPERFEGEGFSARSGFRMLPFGLGRRGCPGENLAMRVMGLTLGLLIQCFEWERTGEEPVDMMAGAGVNMSKAKPLFVKCRPRSALIDLLALA